MVAVEVDAAEEIGEALAAAVRTPAAKVKVRVKVVVIVVPSTLISRQGSGKGVKCIIAGGKMHISVPNPPPVHGRMCSLQSHRNETGTSPAVILLRNMTYLT